MVDFLRFSYFILIFYEKYTHSIYYFFYLLATVYNVLVSTNVEVNVTDLDST